MPCRSPRVRVYDARLDPQYVLIKVSYLLDHTRLSPLTEIIVEVVELYIVESSTLR